MTKTYIITNDRSKQQAAEAVKRLRDDGNWQVDIRPHKAKRSLAQCRLQWFWYRRIQKHISDTTGELYSDDDIHEFMKAKFLPSHIVEVAGEAVRARKSTASLKVHEMTEYLEAIEMYCARDLSLILPRPDDMYWAAMGIKR